MPKTTVERVAETIAYIQQYVHAGVPANIRADIGTMIGTRYPRTTPGAIQAYDQVSNAMAVRRLGLPDPGSSDEREQRRALVLVWNAISASATNPGGPLVNQMLDLGMRLPRPSLATAMTDAMRIAAASASNAGAQWVFDNLFSTQPLTFIQRYRLLIQGTAAGRNLYTDVPVPASFRNLATFNFYYNATQHAFIFDGNGLGGAGAHHQVQAVSVPAVHWSLIPGRGNNPAPAAPLPGMPPVGFGLLRGIELRGADLMLTTQLTGCSFCYVRNGGTAYAAHLLPAWTAMPLLGGTVLAQQLMGMNPSVLGANFINYPAGVGAMEVFGHGAGNFGVMGGNPFYPPIGGGLINDAVWVSVFGRRQGNEWRLYTQAVTAGGGISDARRLC